MIQDFSPLADGLMSYLASRTHDWLYWQIEENNQELKISVIGGNAPLLVERVVPLSSSPSQILDELLEDLAKGRGAPNTELPKAMFPKVRNSLGLGALK